MFPATSDKKMKWFCKVVFEITGAQNWKISENRSQKNLLTDGRSENRQKISKNWSGGQGIDFYHANHFPNLFRIWWENFLAKQIFESPSQPNFSDFLLYFGDQNRAKNQKKLVGKDFQKWFFQKSVLPENFSIKFWTSLKNELHGKNQFPGL